MLLSPAFFSAPAFVLSQAQIPSLGSPFLALALLVLAIFLAVLRLPVLLSLALPAVLGLCFTTSLSAAPSLIFTVLSGINSFSLLGATLWLATAIVAVYSGFYARSLRGLALLFKRSCPQNALYPQNSGLPTLIVVCLSLAATPANSDPHLVALFALPMVGVAVFVGFFWLLRFEKFSKRGPGQSLTEAIIDLLPALLGCIFVVFLLLASPIEMTNLGALALLWVGFWALLSKNQAWLQLSAKHFFTRFASLASKVFAAFLFLGFLRSLQLPQVLAYQLYSLAFPWSVFLLVLLATVILGALFSPEAAIVLALGVFSPAFALTGSALLDNPSDYTAGLTASFLLTAMLCFVALGGVIITQTLPSKLRK